jgi:hypothetical protein
LSFFTADQKPLRLAAPAQAAGRELTLDLQVSCARALQAAAGAGGDAGPAKGRLAAGLVMGVLSASEDNHFGALLLFAEMAAARGQAADAARVALRLLPRAPGDRRVGAALAAALRVRARAARLPISCMRGGAAG